MKPLSVVIAAVSVLVAPVFALAQDETSEEPAAEENVCINTNMVRSFEAFDDMHVYVRQGSSQHFLLTMRSRCLGLEWAQGIAFKDTTSRICSNRFGEIVFRDRTMAQGLQSCRIGKIERVESREAAKELVEGVTDDNRGKDEAAKENEER
ncbi:MAG: DUF6491 family protein [Gammaproteobacteria bacterium]|nr:DUF6491 family protein [Gammaproteobacteria bacterium]MDH5345403.1 DUF6491 family protein [Gammaproteobacteria bacterium]